MPLFGKKRNAQQPKPPPSNGSATNSSASQMNTPNPGNSRPGAQSMANNTATYRVLIPPRIQPGDEFQVTAGSRVVRVRCPPNCRGGQTIQITVPVGNNNTSNHGESGNNNGFIPVTIPEGVRPGQTFTIRVHGRDITVNCPPQARPGQIVNIMLPDNANGMYTRVASCIFHWIFKSSLFELQGDNLIDHQTALASKWAKMLLKLKRSYKLSRYRFLVVSDQDKVLPLWLEGNAFL